MSEMLYGLPITTAVLDRIPQKTLKVILKYVSEGLK